MQGLAEALFPQSETLAAAALFRDPDRQSGGDGLYRSLVLVLFRAVFAHCPPGESLRELGGVFGFCGRGAVGAGGRSLFSRRASSGRSGGPPIRYFFWFAGKASQIGLAAVEMDRGYYAAWALFVYGLVLLYLLAPVKEKRPVLPACACVVTLCLAALLTAKTAQRQDLALTVLDVGQGQSVVVTSQKSRALIDCGGTKHRGTPRRPICSPSAPAMWISCSHPFPRGPRRGRAGAFGPGQGRGHRRPGRGPGQPAAPGDRGPGGGAGYPDPLCDRDMSGGVGPGPADALRPRGSGGESNEQCVSVLCAKGTWEALLTGDMPGEEEVRLANREKLPDIECLIAGHHGSKYSTSEALLQVTRRTWP